MVVQTEGRGERECGGLHADGVRTCLNDVYDAVGKARLDNVPTSLLTAYKSLQAIIVIRVFNLSELLP